MATCPHCESDYEDYEIVGVMPANEHLTDWLEPIPLAMLFCQSCGCYTFMHPDHPDVQRMHRGRPFEQLQENVRTLNVALAEVGDPELREQFEHGTDDT